MTVHFDIAQIDRVQAAPTPLQARRDAGKRADFAGRSAEQAVTVQFDRLGYDLVDLRWRGQAGEIDLIFQGADTYVFVEVKQARTHDQAIARLRPAQMQRIHAAASEYLAYTPDGQLSSVRFDLATVDSTGDIQIIENAFGHF